jgi:hypothetical protein
MPIVYDDQQQPTTQVAGPAMTAPPSKFAYDDQQQAADPYRAAAIKERDYLLSKGVPLSEGYTRRLGMGAGMGWLDEAMAAGSVPFEMIKRGTFNPAEAYRYGIARERLTSEKARENTAGILGAGAELLGGVGSFGSVAAGVAPAAVKAAGEGAAAVKNVAPTLIPGTGKAIPQWAVNTGKNAGVGAGLGVVSGAGEAEVAGPTGEWSNLPKSMATHGLMGGILGAALPPAIQAAGSGLGYVARAAQMPRLFAPQSIADQQIGKLARDAGVPPEQIVQRIADARASGQPGFSVADAIGNEGVRALTAQAKTPGAQREAITEALTTRATQRPQRVGEEVQQAFGAPGTAEEATNALITRAQEQSRPFYQQADAYPTWSNRLQEQFLDHPIAQAGLQRGRNIQSVEAAGNPNAPRRFDQITTNFDASGAPIRGNVDTMATINTMKIGLDDMIEKGLARNFGRPDRETAALIGFKNRMLGEIDAINPAYGEARRLYSEPMRIKDAVQVGQEMVTRGRPADTLRGIRGLAEAGREAELQGVRIGVADKALEPLERTGNLPTYLRAKSPKGVAETEALSLYQGPRRPGEPDQFRQFMNREEAMQRAETKALGGPATAENLADMAAADAAVGDMSGVARDLMTGNKVGLTMRALQSMGRFAQGNSEAQRMAITRALLETDPTAAQQMAARLAQREARARALRARAVGSTVNVP